MNASTTSEINNPIDVVIAWVDGNDPRLVEKRTTFLDRSEAGNKSSAAHATRFASNNEIRYCVLSVLKFAPFVRNIFILTDEQDPELYDIIEKHFPGKRSSVRIVDHKEIFEGYEDYLPTFNSISIGNMIWRIKGLAENFVYFNDDTFLIRDLKPEDWFIMNKPVMRGSWILAPLLRLLWNKIRISINRHLLGNPAFLPGTSFHLGQWRSAALLGYKLRYFTNSHTPHAVGRKTAEDFFESNNNILKNNISHRFRNYAQFTFISLSNHLQLLSGNREIAKPEYIYLKPSSRSDKYIDRKIELCENNTNIRFMCVQSLDMCEKDEQNKILGWLETRILG